MANQDDPNNQNPNVNIMNQPNDLMVQANQPMQNRQRGTGFTNINRILGANVGAGQQLAGRIGGAITGQGARVRQGLGQAQQQFQTGFQQARNEALANIGAASSIAKQPGESDEQYEARVASQTPDYGQIGQNLRSTAYAGPTGFENPNMLLSQAQTAGKLGTFARSGLGQGILARQYGAGRGSYGIGQNIIDQMLLSQDPNAQRALQQARQSVVGLGEGVQSAASAAEEAAQATQTGVEAAKAKAGEDIQKSTQGILARAGQSATDFNKQMESMKRLILGVDEAGNPITEITPEQEALLNKMDEYGLKNASLYMGRQGSNEAQVQDIMNQLAAGMVLNPSGALNLSDTQRQAAMNLARLQNDPTLQQKMLENKFDKQVFKKDISKISDAFNQAKATDQETRDILLRAGNYMKGQEEIATKQNQAYRDAQLAELGPLDPKASEQEKAVYEANVNMINNEYQQAQDLLMGKTGMYAFTTGHPLNIDFSNFNWGGLGGVGMGSPSPRQTGPRTTVRPSSFTDTAGVYRDQSPYRGELFFGLPSGRSGYVTGFDQDLNDDYTGLGSRTAQGLNQAIGPGYGWLAYGDRSADIEGPRGGIDPRFAGLGLTGTRGRGSGGLRTSEDFLQAAEKAMGTNKSIKDLILERIAKNRGNA